MNRTALVPYVVVGIVAALCTIITLACAFALLLTYKKELIASFIAETMSVHQAALEDTESKVIQAVQTANPAVVAITVSKDIPVYERYYQRSPFGGLFGDFFLIPQIRQNGTQLQEIGGGSGFLVSPDGYIVTNRHVVSDENAEYTVFTNNGERYDAVVVARDTVLDVAIIKIEGESFPHLTFGNSDTLKEGQSVIAIGNALAEFRNTVSVGVVSGLSRSIVASDRRGGQEALDQLIQTDAAINDGNSGGPLLNLDGEVVGVNVAIVSGAQNVGFALSSNSVKNIVASVKNEGRIVRPYMGVRYIPVTKELQEKNNLSVAYGVLVQRGTAPEDVAVIPGSPADKAGIVENDIILAFDGTQLDATHSLASLIQTKKVGDTVTLTVLSGGVEKEIELTLEELDS